MPRSSDKSDSQNLFDSPRRGLGSVQVVQAEEPKTFSSSIKIAQTEKKSAINDFKARLKQRFQKFRNRQKAEETSGGRGTVSQVRSTSFRTGRGSIRSKDEDKEEVRSSKAESRGLSFGSRSRFRSRNHGRTSTTTESPKDLLTQPSSQVTTNSRTRGFSRRRTSTNRFRDRVQPTRVTPAPLEPATNSFKLSRPALSKEEAEPKIKGIIKFKKFNRFNRPDIRKSLLEKILKNGKGENTIDPEELEKKKAEKKKKEDLKALIKKQEQLTPGDLEPSVNGLQTTLEVSTVIPTDSPSTYLRIATIRSPYSFDLDDQGLQKSTRFVTVTRTYTRGIDNPQASSSSPVLEILPSKTTKPLFQTETIPAPENILTSSYLEPSHDHFLSSSIETLPAVVFASSPDLAAFKTPPLKTITETFSTKELMLKTSILPIVVNGKTSFHTLTQSYYVTRFVEAVKTLPPMEAYEFIPTKAFTDLNNVLDEAGSEKREQLLPGLISF